MTRMMNTESDELKYVEPIMDETCRGDHQWVFELNSTYLRAPRRGIEVCKNCGCLNEYTQTQVQGGEYGSDFNPENRLCWRARLPNFRERMDLPEQIRARTNVDQVFGMMYQDGLPKRAIRTARRLFFVYFADGSSHRCRTEADDTQAKQIFKGIRRLPAPANPLAGSTPEDAAALAEIFNRPGLLPALEETS